MTMSTSNMYPTFTRSCAKRVPNLIATTTFNLVKVPQRGPPEGEQEFRCIRIQLKTAGFTWTTNAADINMRLRGDAIAHSVVVHITELVRYTGSIFSRTSEVTIRGTAFTNNSAADGGGETKQRCS